MAALGLLACSPVLERKESYPDGKRKMLASYEVRQGDSILHGLRTLWYPDGTKESAETFAHGRRQGYAIRWHTNGRIRSVEHFTDGEPDGQAKYWDDQGLLLACYNAFSGDCLRRADAAAKEADRVATRP